VRAVFNLSGRRRCSFEHGGLWSGPPQQHLVMIGSGLQSEPLLAALRAMEVPAAAVHSVSIYAGSSDVLDASAGATAGAVRNAKHCCDANGIADRSVQHTCTKRNGCNHSSDAAAEHSSSCNDKATCVKHNAAVVTPAASAATTAAAQNSSSISGHHAAAAKARALIDSSEARGMYEWLTPHDSSSSSSSSSVNNSNQQSVAAPTAVLFRFTGQGLYKLTPQQLRIRHGVDLDAVNASIAQVSTR
jgi:hypothetical protein